jgi:transcriptional regulator NrdR family protein
MKCPICQSETKVIDSRPQKKGVWRRRECVNCLTRFNTMENLLFQSLDKHLRDKLLAR